MSSVFIEYLSAMMFVISCVVCCWEINSQNSAAVLTRMNGWFELTLKRAYRNGVSVRIIANCEFGTKEELVVEDDSIFILISAFNLHYCPEGFKQNDQVSRE